MADEHTTESPTPVPDVEPCDALINPLSALLPQVGVVDRAEKAYVYLEGGEKLLDCECGGGVFSLGHRNEKVVAALRSASETWDMGNHHLVSEPKGQLGEKLAALLPGDLRRTVFNVTSSEAVDAAVKLARGATGKGTIFSSDNAYHGATGYSLAASHPAFANSLDLEVPGFEHVPYGDLSALAKKLRVDRDSAAAVLFEPVAVEAGVIMPPEDYLTRLRELCDETKTLLIVDESVTGLGRTGKMFAVDHEGVVPDILIVGRALGGGIYPIHATCHRDRLDPFYVDNPFIHVSTYGGSELGCFCAMAALEEVSKPALLGNVVRHAKTIGKALEDVAAHRPDVVVAHRQLGLVLGVELVGPDAADALRRQLLERGLFCRPAALNPAVLIVLPPLTIGDVEVRTLIDAFNAAVRRVAVGDG